jgi:hypothetical protein
LFPGVVAAVLALAGLLHRSWRSTLLYVLLTIAAVDLSFGVNGVVYRLLSEHVDILQGLRSPSRFAIVALAGIAALAAHGAQVIFERTPFGRRRVLACSALVALLMTESTNRTLPLTPEDLSVRAPVYRVIQSAGPGVVLELPMPRADRLPGWDPYYTAWSTTHWHPLVNGYSGYHPPDYLRTLASMRTFPDDASMARLKAHDVRYIVVHRSYFDADDYAQLMLRMAVRPELRPFGTYRDPVGNAELFVLEH